ncbi:MAG: GNAT family N-acetyltransferase [Burkholderiaceae bacterium]
MSTPAIDLRALASAADWAAFEALLRRYAATDLDQPATSSIWNDLADLPARYGAPTGGVVLAWAGAEAVGCGAFAATREAGLCEVKRFYLLPAWRGRGLGRALVNAVLRQARAAGYARAGLSTWNHNESGLALYRALGFATVPPFKTHPNPDLVYLGRTLDTEGATA